MASIRFGEDDEAVSALQWTPVRLPCPADDGPVIVRELATGDRPTAPAPELLKLACHRCGEPMDVSVVDVFGPLATLRGECSSCGAVCGASAELVR